MRRETRRQRATDCFYAKKTVTQRRVGRGWERGISACGWLQIKSGLVWGLDGMSQSDRLSSLLSCRLRETRLSCPSWHQNTTKNKMHLPAVILKVGPKRFAVIIDCSAAQRLSDMQRKTNRGDPRSQVELTNVEEWKEAEKRTTRDK